MNPWSSVTRSDFISQVPRITTPGRHWTGDPRGDGGRADEGKDTNKMKKKKQGPGRRARGRKGEGERVTE